MKSTLYRFKWKPLDPDIEERLDRILNSWIGTRYALGQCVKGIAADCIHFVFYGILDELYNEHRIRLQNVPPDAAFHSKKTAIDAMQFLLDSYPPSHKVTDFTIEPGDIIVTGAKHGGPGHAMIVGGTENHIWHMGARRVCRTGAAFADGLFTFKSVHRLEDKFRWKI